MRIFFLFILFTLLFSSHTVFATGVFDDCNITTTLRVGSKGAEVKCLQGKVGAVMDGSFGPLTKIAVMTFQSSKGLVADGIVGLLSRAVLNTVMASNGIYPAGCTSTIGYSPTTGFKCDGSLTPIAGAPAPVTDNVLVTDANNAQNINPNLVNLDQFIETVIEVNRENGSSEKELQLMADTVRKVVMNSEEDLNKKFEELLIQEAKLSANFTRPSMSVFDRVISKTLSFFGITPSVAQAAVGLPFGSPFILAVPCIGSWMIAMVPLPPTRIKLISYYPGTQGFASYNIPRTTSLLGVYSKGGVCSYSFVNINTEGTILPMVGSSPI